MDKTEEDKLIADNAEQLAPSNEAEEDVSDVVEVSHDTQVVVKKSGGGLGVFLALLALVATAYLYYLDWDQVTQGTSTETAEKDYVATIQSLQDSHLILKTDLTNAQVELANVLQQIAVIEADFETKLNQIKLQQSDQLQPDANPVQAFDNSRNEQSIEQLNSQLQMQSLLMVELQAEIEKLTVVEPKQMVAAELIPENESLRQNRLAVDVLYQAIMWLETQRLGSAIEAIDEFLKVSKLDASSQSKIAALSDQLKGVKSPDTVGLKQQLLTVSEALSGLQLKTEKASLEEGSWYSRLITVKKIENNETINSTAKLLDFKAEMKHLLLQANLFLSHNQQTGWTTSLADAADLLASQMPEQEALILQLNRLSTQSVAVKLPENINIQSMIDELKGLR